jgi:protoheme IX farnesyltransferase
MNKIKENIKVYSELCKMKISFFSSLSAATGFILASYKFSPEILLLITGVFVLACGSSALNQYQEREVDALMRRTKKRPLPTGRIKPVMAFYFSLMLIVSGLFILLSIGKTSVLILGISAVIWYNGIYTYLKRKTAFAVIPGALIGAIPPAIGWVSGNGALNDPKLSALCFFFFMWQVPHSWILMFDHGMEYEEAGLPSLSKVFSRIQMVRIISHWIFATVVSCLFVLLYGLVHMRITAFSIFLFSLWFVWKGIEFIHKDEIKERGSQAIFKRINYYMFTVIFLLSLDGMTYLWL